MLMLTQLIGFGAGVPRLTTLSLFGSATNFSNSASQTSTVVAPASIQAGDLIVVYNRIGFSGTPTASAPSGFTTATQIAVSGLAVVCSYKKADGTEGGTTITGMGAGAAIGFSMMCYVFRGDAPIGIVTLGSAAQQETSVTPTNQIVTASAALPPLVVIGSWANATTGSTITPRGMSPAKDGEITTDSTHNFLAYKIYNSSPADVTCSMADFGTNNVLQSFYLACA